MSTYTFHVSGTHCTSCKLLIEQILHEQSFITTAEVDLKRKTLTVESEGSPRPEELAESLTAVVAPSGYSISMEKQVPDQQSDILIKAIPIGLGILILFFLLQKTGMLNIGIGGAVTPITSFVIGLIASVSSCLAIVGGLVLSLSAKVSQDNVSDTKTFGLFHVGRLVSFALLGGLLGMIGNAIAINLTVTALLGIVASLVMLALGLNLVGVIERKVTLPSEVFAFFRGIEHKSIAPLILGFATFFLPCGFTQSMQVAALSSGSFTSGSLIMFSFALGTLPMLALLSFGSTSFAQSRHAALFFKSAGVVVIGFGLFALLSGLAGLGLIIPLFNF